MTRKVFAGLVVCAAVGSGLATRTIVGQGQSQAAADEYQQHVLPVLSKSCMSCHNDRTKAGTLSLEAFRDPSAALAQQAIWPKVLERVSAGSMPPPAAAPPANVEGENRETRRATFPRIAANCKDIPCPPGESRFRGDAR